MKRTVSAMEARRRLGELLEGVYYRGDEVTIERAGKVMAVVVPAKDWQEHQEAKRRADMERLFEIIHSIHLANPDLQDLSDDELQAFIDDGTLPSRTVHVVKAAR